MQQPTFDIFSTRDHFISSNIKPPFFSVETERGKNGRNVILPKIDNGRNHEVLARKEARSRGHGGHSHVSRKKRHGHVPQVRYLRDSLSDENINRTFKKKSLDNTELSVFEKVKYLLCFI